MGTAIMVSVWLPPALYQQAWQTRKHLTSSLSSVLVVTCAAMVVGAFFAAWAPQAGRGTTIRLTSRQVRFLGSAYRILMVLSVAGYMLWIIIGIAGGIGWADLVAVLDRSDAAADQIKRLAVPVAGVTTLAQFGPVAVAIGVLLRRIGVVSRAYRWLFVLAGLRALFYSERLALAELVIPAVIVLVVTVPVGQRRWRWMVSRVAPILAVPVLWTGFAVFEYWRSWVAYQQTSGMSFTGWVSLRLAGYYTTSINNSALFASTFPARDAAPRNTFEFFWNAPVISSVVTPPRVSGVSLGEWWTHIRSLAGNEEFTNIGSFLVTYVELGPAGSVLYWFAAGVVFGRLYHGMRSGRVASLLAYASLFVALLELPRLIYLGTGRAIPQVLALAVIAVVFAVRWPRQVAYQPDLCWPGHAPRRTVRGIAAAQLPAFSASAASAGLARRLMFTVRTRS
jgi:hypothetical protein